MEGNQGWLRLPHGFLASRLQLPQSQQHMFSSVGALELPRQLWLWPGREEDTGGEIGHDELHFMLQLLIGGANRREGRAFRIDNPFLLRKQNLIPHPP